MSQPLNHRIFDELNDLVLIDPHTHINPLQPASQTLADLLGYHYYTELAHSAGLPRERIEEPGISAKEKVGRIFEGLAPINNTIQWSWMVELSKTLFGFQSDTIDANNWESLYDLAESKMSQPDWASQVLRQSKIESVFLTNDFDDPLANFDTQIYIPCLRTDEIVFHLAKPSVRERLQKATGIETSSIQSLRESIGKLFAHFLSRGVRACAISLPPYFSPQAVSKASAEQSLANLLRNADQADSQDRLTMAYWTFWTLAEFCSEHCLPFDLMIGVNRQVYPNGVYQGQDLYDSRVSLIQYAPLLNAFPKVTFPISVLASVTNQELVDYAWIFPNVVTNGHWWYSNTPSFIRRDLAARLEAIPRTKQIGYYSDAYKLEFTLPKFAMFKRVLSQVLAEEFVIDRGWSEEKAVLLGTDILRGNVERIFPAR